MQNFKNNQDKVKKIVNSRRELRSMTKYLTREVKPKVKRNGSGDLRKCSTYLHENQK